MSMVRGERNLVILGCGAILLTIITTTVSLAIYRTSGDIYLDRSRPGYLPDVDEVQEDNDADSNFTFAESGPLTTADLDEYLEALYAANSRLRSITTPYSPEPLSDTSLGIPSEFAEESDAPLADDIDVLF